MTPEEANQRMRAMCIEAMDIADSQGWDWTIDARPKGRSGWMFTVFNDKVKRAPKPAPTQEAMDFTAG